MQLLVSFHCLLLIKQCDIKNTKWDVTVCIKRGMQSNICLSSIMIN